MTVENIKNKMPPQQMGASEYQFNFSILLGDPTEEAAKSSIKAAVVTADGRTVELVYGSNDSYGYNVTLNTTGNGGTITVNDKRTSNDYITIYRRYGLKQEADFQDFNAAPADTTEQCFDKGIMIAQQLQEELNRSIKVPITSAVTNLSLPIPVAGRTLKWNDEETGLINSYVSIDDIDSSVEKAIQNANISSEQANIAISSANKAEERANKAKEYMELSGGKGMPTDICKNLSIIYDVKNRKAKLKWKDPNDTINSLGQIMSSWAGTKITYKENSYPENYDDGVMILDNKIRNQHENQEFVIDVPENILDITTLKFRAFPYSVNDVYNKDKRNCFDQTNIYEFLFDSTNSNVNGSITYPGGCANEYFTPVKMDYSKNVFDYGSWKDTFIMDLAKPCMLYNKNANNIGLTIFGDLGNESGIFTGFTTSIYGDIDYIPENIEEIENFEIVADFITGSSITTTQQTIYGNSKTNGHSPQLAIISKKLQWNMPNSNYAYIDAMTSYNELKTDTHYISKLKYSKTESLLSAYLATNEEEAVKIGDVSVSSLGWDEVMRMGLDLTANPFNGSINVKGCYIEVNGEKVFDGSKYKSLNGQIMEILNPEDYTKTIDGADSHITDEKCNANAMVQWDASRLWVKVEEYLPEKFHYYVANKQVDSSYKNYLQYDKEGNIKQYYYNAMYDGCNINNIIRSISGKSPCDNITGDAQLKCAKTNGKGYDVTEKRFIVVRNILLMLIGKSTDSQTIFGSGRVSGGSNTTNNKLVSGQLNNKGQFYGDNNNGSVKVFHSENPWGNIWKILQGIILVNGILYLKLTPNTNDGSSANSYNTNGQGYINTGITINSGSTGGYINKVSLSEGYALLPSGASGSSSTYIPDGCWFNNSIVSFACYGSCCGDGLLAGAFSIHLGYTMPPASWAFGATLSYI